jgi:carotenoid cleavage dioxygenase-like enzyme
MPDGKTAVFLTDNPNFLVFDLEDLSTKGWLDWNTKDFESSATGATHVVNDISTGDLLGIMTEMKTGIHTEYQMAFYRIKADDITKKILIGRIPMGTFMPYMHSFGHTEELLIFQQNSIGFNVGGMMEGKPMEDNFVFDWDRELSFHVMKIADGTFESYPAGHAGYILHTGNNFIDSDGKLVTEAEMYVEAEIDPFQIMDREWLLNPDRAPHHVGARLRRYYIDLDTKEVTYKTLL